MLTEQLSCKLISILLVGAV